MTLAWAQGHWHQTPPPPASVASASHGSNAPQESNGSEVLALGPDFRCMSCIRRGPRSESKGSNASKVVAWGATLDSLDAIRFGPGSESTGGNESKVLALGPTLDSFGSS